MHLASGPVLIRVQTSVASLNTKVTALTETVDMKTRDLESMQAQRAKDGSSITALEKEIDTLRCSLESKSNLASHLEEKTTKNAERLALAERAKETFSVGSMHCTLEL